MYRKYAFIIILLLTLTALSFAQRPGGGGRPGGGMPRGDGPQRDMQREGPEPRPDWFRKFDTGKNGSVDAAELTAGVDAIFARMDRNGNGVVESEELRPQPGDNIPPPFFLRDRVQPGQAFTKAQMQEMAREVFNEMDRDKDGLVSREEGRPPRREDGPPQMGGRPGIPPNAKFIGAELRFGDKLVKGQPFSADILIEDTRRLFDGTTVTKQSRGAVYRDGEGRTRREQPLAMVGGVGIVGNDNKPQMLVFINDFATRTQIFLDANNKIARKDQIGRGPGPQGPGEPRDAKTESLGTKVIDGVSVEGTRVTFEIPAGEIGNDKPMQVISERWFSTELQVLVMSRHLDPLSGEHVFKLVNIKRAEPAADLFSIPSGYKVETPRERRPEMQ
ncbi:MAG: EF-hand domain-containing protein [Pyrinomonadaceae bacterium]|nr:EF-hand domain-containing protein [Pyrinomonadaceae bacterium]MBP6212500.1 EF-hand domain-containing protein [Pyrinomonadaceae bacterium]